MGNYTNVYESEAEALDHIRSMGFTPSEVTPGWWRKPSMAQGSLSEAPRLCVALVQPHFHRVSPQYGGQHYWSLHWL